MNEKQKLIEEMNDAVIATLDVIPKAIPNEDIGYIFYIFDRSENGGGTGCNSNNCDMGDAMVAIKRIAGQFGIDLELLARGVNK